MKTLQAFQAQANNQMSILQKMSWIHSFAVTDTQTHKNGYTIYKITSIVFPRAIPQALTCITVWKRFHDIKKLHRELLRRQKSFKISGKMPEPTDSTYFKRFDSNIIQRRKEFIVEFLDFVAQHPPLYKCHIFFQFFNDGTNPNESPLHALHVTKSRTACPMLNTDNEHGKETKDNKTEVTANHLNVIPDDEVLKYNETVEQNVTCNVIDKVNKKPTKDYTRFLTPMASIESIEDSDYIYEAALEFSHAVQAEANLKYSEAHMRYKRGVELLLNGCKNDGNDERKFIAKTKISKYLARADDIFHKFLDNPYDTVDAVTTDTKNVKVKLQLSLDGVDGDILHPSHIEYPLNQLAKYKVLKILGQRVLLVKSVTERQRQISYVIKGIEKPSSNAPNQTIFLPQHVPYMVELLACFQSEQKVYLLLRFAEGGRLIDWLENYQSETGKRESYAGIFPNDDSKEEIETPSDTHEDVLRSSERLIESVTKTLQIAETKKSGLPQINQKDRATCKQPLKKLPEASLKQWARELFVAIECLHEKGVILGDLNMRNLLLGEKGQLLITYFYQNQTMTEELSQCFYAQTEHFMAPERPLCLKSDWWCFGVILYQLLLGLPFKSMHPGRIDIYGFVQYPDNVEISDSARDLLDNLLQQAPEERFDANNIREHEFFKGTNWEELYANGLNTTLQHH